MASIKNLDVFPSSPSRRDNEVNQISVSQNNASATQIQIDDNSIIERIQNDDGAAVNDLFRACYNGLCQFVFLQIHSIDETEDIIQDIFLRIWLNRKNWYPIGSTKAYLYKAARNHVINYFKQNRVRNRSKQKETELDSLSSNYPSPLDDLTNSDLQLAVQKAIEDLPTRCKFVFTLHRQEGLSHREIANILGISQKTVENQMTRALRLLKKKLSAYL